MTRQDLQNEAFAIEALIDAAMATFGTGPSDDAYEVLIMAHRRAKALSEALDSVNQPDL